VSILDILFPKKCVGCGRAEANICPKCAKTARLAFPQVCPACERASIGGVTHKRCVKSGLPDGLISIWAYERLIRNVVKKLKYRFVYEIAEELGILASNELNKVIAEGWIPKNDKIVMVPVPLHWTRENWRGFNHSREVAKIIGEQLGWRVVDLLTRVKKTRSQVGLGEKDRQKNMEGVFSLSLPLCQGFAGQASLRCGNDWTIILFDDVWTTGSTMKEAIKVLKQAGFKEIWCLTLAR